MKFDQSHIFIKIFLLISNIAKIKSSTHAKNQFHRSTVTFACTYLLFIFDGHVIQFFHLFIFYLLPFGRINSNPGVIQELLPGSRFHDNDRSLLRFLVKLIVLKLKFKELNKKKIIKSGKCCVNAIIIVSYGNGRNLIHNFKESYRIKWGQTGYSNYFY